MSDKISVDNASTYYEQEKKDVHDYAIEDLCLEDGDKVEGYHAPQVMTDRVSSKLYEIRELRGIFDWCHGPSVRESMRISISRMLSPTGW